MSLNVTSVEISLSSWFFPLIERKSVAAPPVVETIPAGLCHRFHVGHPTRAPAPGCHRPVPHLQAGFHEQSDLRSRELWALSGQWGLIWSGQHKSFSMEGEQKEKERRMSGWWILAIIAIWLLLQAYILPKFGISTWLRNSCQLGSPEDKITETYKWSDK